MLCENCQENEATIHYIEIINGVKTEHHLCSSCADKLDLSDYVSVLDIDIPFVKLLTGLLSQNGGAVDEEDNPMQLVKCPQCGMSFAEFTRVGKFGCAECYDVFGPLIEDNMKKLHGSIQHKGKVYKKIAVKGTGSKNVSKNGSAKGTAGKQAAGNARSSDDIAEEIAEDTVMESGADEERAAGTLEQITELTRQLKDAVRREKFEDAARLRDQIKALKERNDKNA